MKILLAEDEKSLSKIIKLYLEQESYHVTVVSNGLDAISKLENSFYDLAILDWMMPKRDGIEVCKWIREMKLSTKVLILTAKSNVDDEIYSLSSGADDYIKKPFDTKVLLLRIERLLQPETILNCEEITLDRKSKRVTVENIELLLSKKEFDLLEFLMINKGIVLSREAILNKVWGMLYEGDIRTVDTHIRRLRAKIGNERIVTYKGQGYSIKYGAKS